jgi:hypothetical protein
VRPEAVRHFVKDNPYSLQARLEEFWLQRPIPSSKVNLEIADLD